MIFHVYKSVRSVTLKLTVKHRKYKELISNINSKLIIFEVKFKYS